MSANRQHWFYSGILTTAAAYTDVNSFGFNGALGTLKIANDHATQSLKFSTIGGGDDAIEDGELLAGETKTFEDVELNKIAVKNGSGISTCRIWAY